MLQYAKARPVLAIIAGVLFAGSAAAQGANPFAFFWRRAAGRSIRLLAVPALRPAGDHTRIFVSARIFRSLHL